MQMQQDFLGGSVSQGGRARHELQQKIAPKAAGIVAGIREDIRSLSSSVLIITQKMKYLVRNEKILGRNLIVLNKKIRALEERLVSGDFASGTGLAGSDTQALLERLEDNNKKIAELEARITQLGESTASREQLQELKYVIDSINPLEFATVAQVKEMLESKLGRKK